MSLQSKDCVRDCQELVEQLGSLGDTNGAAIPNRGKTSRVLLSFLFETDTLRGGVGGVGGAVFAVGGCTMGRGAAKATTAIRWVSLCFGKVTFW